MYYKHCSLLIILCLIPYVHHAQEAKHCDIITSENVGCAPFEVSFSLKNIKADSCCWFFGDGVRSKELNPKHTFTKAGKYTIEAVVYSKKRAYNLIRTHWIEVFKLPKPDFRIDTNACQLPYASIRCKAKDSTAKEYIWDFGDGNKMYGKKITYTYRTTGTFLVKLTVTNSLDCATTSTQETFVTVSNSYQPYADFSASATLGCDSLTTSFKNLSLNTFSYYWDFGDGEESSVAEPTHVYKKPGAYTVMLTATGVKGQTMMFKSKYIQVGEIPESDFVADFPRSAVDEEIRFKPITNIDFVHYHWDFGDGQSSEVANPIHSYQRAGNYTVTFKGVTASGCVVVENKSNYVIINAETRLENLRLGNKTIFGKIYPNPCQDNTLMSLYLPKPTMVNMYLYNVQGQKIATLLSEEYLSGVHKFPLANLMDTETLSSGVYFVRTQAGEEENMQKLTYLK